jgi:hypothetical protein
MALPNNLSRQTQLKSHLGSPNLLILGEIA